MQSNKLELHVRHVNNHVSVIVVHGDMTAAAERHVMDAYSQASGPAVRGVVLNFAGLQYMNSSGIGIVVALLVQANRQKQRLFACNLNEHYRHIFELTRLNESISIYPTEAEALLAAQAVQRGET